MKKKHEQLVVYFLVSISRILSLDFLKG